MCVLRFEIKGRGRRRGAREMDIILARRKDDQCLMLEAINCFEIGITLSWNISVCRTSAFHVISEFLGSLGAVDVHWNRQKKMTFVTLLDLT